MLLLWANASHFLSGDNTAQFGVSGFSTFAVSVTVPAYVASAHSKRLLPTVMRRAFSSSFSRKVGSRIASTMVSPANDMADARRTLSKNGVFARFAGSTTYHVATPLGAIDR